ncbi:MAG: hypothetical protein OHK0039_07670 [Bacteroidia bacterium]
MLLVLLLALVAGAGLYVLFAVLRYLVLPLVGRTSYQRWLQRWFPLAETLSWVAYVVVVVIRMLLGNPIPGMLVLLIFTAVAWVPLRNFFTGLVLRLVGDIDTGQRIRIGDIRGTVARLRAMHLEVNTPAGQHILLPYHDLAQAVIVQEEASDKLKSHTFDLETPDTAAAFDLEQRISRYILSLPWTVQTHLPQVRLADKSGSSVVFRITLYAIHAKYFPQIEEQVRRRFGLYPEQA